MKKFIGYFLIAAAVLAVTGCSKKDAAETTQSAAESSAAEAETLSPGAIVKLADYVGVELTKQSEEVTDEELEARIQSILSANPEYVEVDRPAEEGDTVNIDYVGLKDGVAFDGGTAQGYDLEIGSGSFIDGFEDGLMGASAGEERSLNLTFPEQYHSADLAGQAVVFDVTVNAVKEKHDAELTDTFVQKISDFKTVDEFREDTLAALKANKKSNAEQMLEADALQAVLDASEIDINQEALEKRLGEQMEYANAVLAQQGVTLEDYLSMFGRTVEEYETEMKAQCEMFMKQELLIDAIAEAESLEVTDEDYRKLADAYGATVETMKQTYGDDFERAAKNSRVLDYLVDNAVIK